ncbi:MAG: hypothetical protein M3068_09230 [Gemmatimonadota bacterium]|nr:hypothetical protein [Gemmatimonadota bacterium]
MTSLDPASGFPSIELRAGSTRLVIIPALGGKIAAMEMGGREWLWRSDVIPLRAPTEGESYVKTADSGGYDECFPTVGACTLPQTATGFGGLELPDHGELWSQHARCEVDTRDGLVSRTDWTGRRMPYRFSRQITVDPTGTVAMRYAATNSGRDPLPFVWSSHPLFPLTPDTRIVLPQGARVRVYAQHGIELLGAAAEHRWPRLRGERELDLSAPNAVARSYACKLFLEMPVGEAALEQGGARLSVSFDAGEVPNFGLWLNKRGWSAFGRGKKRYLNLAFEPCIGAPDTLSDALGDWKSAHWIAAGETRSWTLTWSAAPIPA